MAWTGWLVTGGGDVDAYWPNCDLDGDELYVVLAAAREQCVAFAPSAPPGEDVEVPESWRLAQAMQARALWRSAVAGGGNRIGGEDLGVTVFPMDWTVKALLRPKAGKPVIW